MSETTAKRLAKNTIYMYMRMGFMMLISLYTSRVVLQKLGVDDYGTYNLVGSIVTMFAALRGFFATSTQRFINFEIGRRNEDILTLIFNMSVLINLVLALIFVVAVEGVGYWFLNYKIVIDPSRLFAAKVVFHISVFSAVVSMLTSPFDALIIAHERMDYYAIFAVLEGFLHLGVAFLLGAFGFDLLIFYGFLQLLVCIIMCILNANFSRKHFPECRYQRRWNKDVFKQMTSFASWNFFGNTAFSLVQSGLNMLLNMFCGLSANAARGIAYQVNAAVNRVQKSVSIVVNPFSTKAYASGQEKKMFDMMFFSTKAYYIILSCVVIPLIFLAQYVLQIWLGQVPKYAVGFLQIVLLYSLIRTPHEPITILFMSVGDIRMFQIVEILVQSCTLIISYFLLKNEITPYWVFGTMCFLEIVNYIMILLVAKKVTPISLSQYFKKAILPCVICFSITTTGFVLNSLFNENVVLQIMITLVTLITVLSAMYFIGLSEYEKGQLKAIVQRNNR